MDNILLPFLSFVVINTFTPGPNNILSMSNAATFGFRKSYKLILGMFLGFFMVIEFCSVFSLSLFSLFPHAQKLLSTLGVFYMLYLAWKVYHSSTDFTHQPTMGNTLLVGFLLQFINPKVILFGITTLTTFIFPYTRSIIDLTYVSLFLAFFGLLATTSWAFFGSLSQRIFHQYIHQLNLAMSLFLLYSAYSLWVH